MYCIRHKLAIWTLIGLMGTLGVSSGASATPISDVADGVNDALFGGSNLFAAQAMLTAIVMVSVGLTLAMLRLNFIATFIVLFCVLGALTAMGWADPTLILVAGLFVVAMFVKKVADYWSGRAGADAGET